MKKLQTLQNSQQFRKVYEQGQNIHTSLFSAFFLKTEIGQPRVGITVTRKIGNAVVRNRCKRRLRDAIRKRFSECETLLAFDLVINAKSGLVEAEFSSIEEALAKVLNRFANSISKS